jgi:hypothetical protein
VRCFKKLGKSLDKLKSPNLEKALEFLDDKLLRVGSSQVGGIFVHKRVGRTEEEKSTQEVADALGGVERGTRGGGTALGGGDP